MKLVQSEFCCATGMADISTGLVVCLLHHPGSSKTYRVNHKV